MSRSTIALGPEPPGLLLKKAAIFAWVPGLDQSRWDKVRPTLQAVMIFGGPRALFYRKDEIKAKLIDPLLAQLR